MTITNKYISKIEKALEQVETTIDYRDLAEQLSISPGTIKRYVLSGTIDGSKITTTNKKVRH